MTSITRTLTLSLSVAAAAIFLVLLSIVMWLDVARERELTFCQAAAAILNRATVVDPSHGLTIRSTDSIGELKSTSPNLWYVVSYDGLMTEFGRELRPALPFRSPIPGRSISRSSIRLTRRAPSAWPSSEGVLPNWL
jgi:hypothetical protein